MNLRRVSTTASVLTLCLLVCCAVYAQRATELKRVVVLYWYNKDHPWNVGFEQGFQSTLAASTDPAIEYYAEFLENNRFPGDRQSLLFRDYLRQKYSDRSIDVVVANSDYALDFLLKYRNDLFPTTPIAFVAARRPSTEQLAAGLTGILNINDYKENLQLVLKLQPDTRQVFVISGTLEGDKRFETVARQDLQSFESKVQIIYLTDLSLEELIAKTRSLPARSVILHVWQQSRNQQGRVLENGEMLSAIAESANVPIYGMNFRTLFTQPGYATSPTGVVGGYATTSSASGKKTAEIVVKLAKGTRPQDIPVGEAPTEPIFDWRELRRWNISEINLPAGSMVQFRQVTFWSHYKWHIIGVIALISLEALLIVALLVQRARRARDIDERQQAQRELQHLTGQLIHLQDEERKRIARELHDSLGQSLVIIKNRATIGLRDASDTERIREQLEEISSTATAAIDEVHEIAHNLRPYELDRLGLVKALETMVDKLANSSSIHFSADLDAIDGLLSPAAETSVYRIVQEGLNNVVKHADATEARVSVKQTDGRLILSVSDNGKGLRRAGAGENGRGFGLAGMAERARLLGGSMEVDSPSDGGTKIIVTLGSSESANDGQV